MPGWTNPSKVREDWIDGTSADQAERNVVASYADDWQRGCLASGPRQSQREVCPGQGTRATCPRNLHRQITMNTTQHTDNPFPALSEEGQEQAARLIEDFKKAMANAAEEALASLYSDVMPYIEGDSWSNFRRDAINQLKGYNREKEIRPYDFRKIRAKMLEEHREEIIGDLNADLLAEVEDLRSRIQRERDIQERRAYL
jgi:hypothetical protein